MKTKILKLSIFIIFLLIIGLFLFIVLIKGNIYKDYCQECKSKGINTAYCSIPTCKSFANYIFKHFISNRNEVIKFIYVNVFDIPPICRSVQYNKECEEIFMKNKTIESFIRFI